jgi:3',5'-cyclic AMP phosphodiesterase CpdA
VKKDLFFNKDGKFKILQFTDIHFTDDNEVDLRTTKLMEQLIREENPDFIIATGDTVYGPNNTVNITKALDPMVQSGATWSIIFGNHDTEEGESYEKLFPIITELPNCAAYNADDTISGSGNHYLEVKNSQGETKWVLFGIDSGNYNPLPSVGGYDYVKSNQIDWFKRVNREIEQTASSFSSLVYMHMPLPEYNDVWDREICYGEKREDVCCPKINSGFFTAMLETGHTKGVFAGHDHINDYMGTLYGITLGYGRATGYNTYSEEGYRRGARIFLLDENNTDTFETYIRLEDGSVIKEPKLHQPEHVEEQE